MKQFKFKKNLGETAYVFSLDGEYNGRSKWKRKDKNVVVVFIDHIGWCILDENLNQVGWPFAEIRDMKSKTPPEGKWISWKEGKSYTYDLIMENE